MEPLVEKALKKSMSRSSFKVDTEGRKVDRATVEGNPLEALWTAAEGRIENGDHTIPSLPPQKRTIPNTQILLLERMAEASGDLRDHSTAGLLRGLGSCGQRSQRLEVALKPLWESGNDRHWNAETSATHKAVRLQRSQGGSGQP